MSDTNISDAPSMSTSGDFDDEATAFYRGLLRGLDADEVPFLVGGSFAATCYTGRERPTKDVDLFIRRGDLARAADALRQVGGELEMTYPHWLAKVHGRGFYLDVIFNSGNGVAAVDDAWFAHAGRAELLGVPVGIPPVEELIWMKAFVMERERYDGADVAHLIHARAERIDWPRLLRRFESHWRLLLSHLLLFTFIYPSDRDRIPRALFAALLDRARDEHAVPPPDERICRGTLLSREQYLLDIDLSRAAAYGDARLLPPGSLAQAEINDWTAAIAFKVDGHGPASNAPTDGAGKRPAAP